MTPGEVASYFVYVMRRIFYLQFDSFVSIGLNCIVFAL